jgi:hypothetical protein
VAYRELRDAQGRDWRVWDTHPQSVRHGSVPEDYAKGWITFECAAEKRRLIPIPSGWSELPEPELLDLLGAASAVTTRMGRL